jgi:hypothetical protein
MAALCVTNTSYMASQVQKPCKGQSTPMRYLWIELVLHILYRELAGALWRRFFLSAMEDEEGQVYCTVYTQEINNFLSDCEAIYNLQ